MKIIKKRFSIIHKIKSYFKDCLGSFVLNSFCCIFIKITTLISPVFYGIFIEKVILNKNLDMMLWIVIGFSTTQLLQSFLKVINIKLSTTVKNSFTKSIRVKLLDIYLSVKSEGNSEVATGEVKKIIEDDVEKISAFSEKQTIDFAINLLVASLLAIALLFMDWRLAIVALVSIPVTVCLDYKVSSGERVVNDILNKNDSEWGTWITENIDSFKEIRVNQIEQQCEKDFLNYQNIDERYFLSWLRFWVSRTLVIPKIKDEFVMRFLLYFIGGILIYYKCFSIGTLLVFVQYFGILSNSINEVSKENADLISDMPFIDRLLERLSKEEDLISNGNCRPEQYNISLDKLSFGYNDKSIIEDLSLNISQGERVGIKGCSGAGKSTLLKLILGIEFPSAGYVKYGDIDIKEIDLKYLYNKIAYIGQNSDIFNMSIIDNLLIGKPNATIEQIKEACKKACISDYIESLEYGYHTVIEEKGNNLSGGQKQRILLARAFLRDPNIYVLDEVTSALDGAVEDEICGVIDSIPKDKTIIIVSHQDKLFSICDRLIELKAIA